MDSERARQQQIALNRIQNAEDFQINLEDQPIIFKQGLFKKILEPPKDNPEDPKNYRTVTIKCTQLGCRYVP
jgi:hypothetical protein